MATQKKKKKVHPRDMAWNTEEKEGAPQGYGLEHRRKRRCTPEIWLGTQKKKKQKKVNRRDIVGNAEEEEGAPQRYSWDHRRRRRRRRRLVIPRDIAGKAKEEEEGEP